MTIIFKEILYFSLPLIVMGLAVKYFFRVNVNILLPSAIMLLLFIIMTNCSSLTSKKYETELFAVFCIFHLLALVGGIFLMSKQEVLWNHFFGSLIFQLFYWLILFYYGGIQFTHKFEPEF